MTAAVHSAIKFEPEWEPPEQLDDSEVNEKVEKKLRLHYEGLKTITIKAEYRNNDNQRLSESLGAVRIKGGGKGEVPGIDASTLVKVIYARANEHALQVKMIVAYRLTFFGDGIVGQPQVSFRLDGRVEEDEEDEDDYQVPPVRRGAGVSVLPTGMNGRRSSFDSEAITAIHVVSQQSAGLFAELRASMQQQRMDYSAMITDIRGFFGEMREELASARTESSKANARIAKMSSDQTQHFHNQQQANEQGWQAFHTGMQMQLKSLQQSMSWERQYMFMQFDQLATEKTKDDTKSIAKEWGPLVLGAVGQILESKGSPAGRLLQEYALKTMGDDDEDDEEDDDEPEEASSSVMGVPSGEDPKKHFNENPIVSMVQLLNSMLTKEQRTKLKELLPPLGWKALDSALKAKKDMMARAFLMQFIVQVKSVDGLDDKLKAELNKEQFELFNDIAETVTKGIRTKPKPQTVIDVQVTSAPQKGPPPPPSKVVAGDEPIPKAKPPAAPRAPKAKSPTKRRKPKAAKTNRPRLDAKWDKGKLRKYAKKHYGLDLPQRMSKPKMLAAIKDAMKVAS